MLCTANGSSVERPYTLGIPRSYRRRTSAGVYEERSYRKLRATAATISWVVVAEAALVVYKHIAIVAEDAAAIIASAIPADAALMVQRQRTGIK